MEPHNTHRTQHFSVDHAAELSTGRMDPRVGSGRVGSGHGFAGFWRVGSGQHFGFLSLFFLLITSRFLNRYEFQILHSN